jgi:Kef-type K+ transport system membrane component KefB
MPRRRISWCLADGLRGDAMSVTPSATAHLVLATTLLLVVAHATGGLFARWRYPRVVGETVGGLMLGPSLLGAALPAAEHGLFPSGGAALVILRAFEELGVVFVMFAAGAEFGVLFRRGERRTAASITLSGVVLPFAAAILVFHLVHIDGIEGSAHVSRALSYVFAAAVAVTSIPAISRVMMDLGVAKASFARVVLGAAAMEDIVLYAVLSVAVGLAENTTDAFGLAHAVGIRTGSVVSALYYASATLIVLAIALVLRLGLQRLHGERDPMGTVPAQLVVIFAITAACMFASVTSVFGGFAAGIVVGGVREGATADAVKSINRFAFAFFIPLYFAIVGWRLDLVHNFDVIGFIGLLALACIAKGVGVYIGARTAGEDSRRARDFAIVMNARGGMGIVLATVALNAHIISEQFYADIVVLSIVTLLAAGLWLERIGRGWKRPREAFAVSGSHPSAAVIQTSPFENARPPALKRRSDDGDA